MLTRSRLREPKELPDRSPASRLLSVNWSVWIEAAGSSNDRFAGAYRGQAPATARAHSRALEA